MNGVDGLNLEVGNIIPDEKLNQRGGAILFWKVPIKVTSTKEAKTDTHRVFMSFIDATSVEYKKQKCFAKYMVNLEVNSGRKQKAPAVKS